MSTTPNNAKLISTMVRTSNLKTNKILKSYHFRDPTFGTNAQIGIAALMTNDPSFVCRMTNL